MKLTNKAFIAAAGLVVLLAACQKQEAQVTEQNQEEQLAFKPLVISASMDEDTKAAVSSTGTFSWTAGDVVAYHTTEGYLISGGASESAAKADFVVDGSKTRDAFAIYPSSIVAPAAENYGQSGKTLDVTLPDTYTLAEVGGVDATQYTTPCPMIAISADDTWHFRQLCGMLRLTVNSVPPSANKITVDFNGKKVTGDFSVAAPVKADGSSMIYTNSGTGSAEDLITITFSTNASWRDDVVINLPLPVSPAGDSGKYGDVTVKVYADAKELLSLTRPVKLDATYAAARAVCKNTTVSMPVFSVSASNRVIMAESNLQYTRDASYRDTEWTKAQGSWSFMPYPWSDTDETDTGLGGDPRHYKSLISIGFFSWGTSGKDDWAEGTYGSHTQPWDEGTYSNGSQYGPYSAGSQITGELTGDTYKYGDWGIYNNAVLGNPNPSWRTMTIGEMRYMLGLQGNDPAVENPTNTKRNQKWGRATVNGVAGIIIVPDRFVDPMKNGGSGAFVGGVVSTYSAENSNIYTEEQWTYMAAMGARFLPAAGRREMNGTNYPAVYNRGEYGYYCSTTGVSTTGEWGVIFTPTKIAIWTILKNVGSCVRLVRNVN